MCHFFIIGQTHHHHSIIINIYSILFCNTSHYSILKLCGITLKWVMVKALTMNWIVPQKGWLIMLLNKAVMSFKMISWDESSQLSRKILYEFISSEDAALCAELKSMNPRPTHGAMKLHVVASSADGINYRNTSCYCLHCFKKGVFTYNCDECKSFSRSQILEFASTVSKSASISSSLIEYTLGYFVAAIYEVEHHVYVGTAVEIDESDNI